MFQSSFATASSDPCSLWGFSLGRPFRVDSEEVTVKRLPRSATLADFERWTDSFTTSTATSSLPSVSERSGESSYLVVEQWVSFCEELAPLVRILLVITSLSFVVEADTKQLRMRKDLKNGSPRTLSAINKPLVELARSYT